MDVRAYPFARRPDSGPIRASRAIVVTAAESLLSRTLTSEPAWDEPLLPQVGPMTTMALGAAVGFAVGYLYLTEEGRRFRTRIGPWLDQSIDEIRRLREAALKARRAWDEGRDSLNAVRHLGSGPRGNGW
jgi:hypothetical protein